MPGTRHFSRMNYNVQRGLRELLNERFITKAQWRAILDFFSHRCVFCGIEHSGNNRTGLVPDHLIAAAHYGELCMGNAVPSCQDCNDRRGHSPWEQYLKKTFPAEARVRISRINEYLALHPYSAMTNPAHVLREAEHAEYLRLLGAWARFWGEARALRDVVKKRRAEASKPNKRLQATRSKQRAPEA